MPPVRTLQLNLPQRPFLYHIIAWSIFILYEVSFVRLIRWDKQHTALLTGYILPYIVNIGLFYVHAFIVLSYCLRTGKRVALLPLLVALEIVVYLVMMSLINGVTKEGYLFLFPDRITFIQQLWRGIYFLIFSTAFWLIHESFKKQQRLEKIEREALLQEGEKKRLELQLVSSQNAFLQAQINPHLLFNALNFIHSEVQEHSSDASAAIITLSDMMRYSLTAITADGKVLLNREVEQIENLIQINQYRFHATLHINFQVQGVTGTERMIPLLLVPLVENIFKYGDLKNAQHPAQIEITMQNEYLFFMIANLKRKSLSFPSPGIGIENVKKRLEQHYAGNYTMQIKDEPDVYSLNLQIKL